MARRTVPVLLLLLALLLAGCNAPAATPEGGSDAIDTAAVQGGAGGSGGSVANSAPAISNFSADRTQGDNDGSLVVVFSGTTFDRNTEAQIATLRVNGSGPVAFSSLHAVTPAERLATSEPGSFGADGWKVWGGTARDGAIHWRYRQAFPAFTPAGAYDFRATATDTPGLSGSSGALTVTLRAFSLITVQAAPVNQQGLPIAGASWGGWTAEAGARDVASTNFLKIVNDGDSPDARVVIDFTEAGFLGVEDANFSVPIDGNVHFGWWEDTTPALTSPAEGTFPHGAASPNGAVTLQFTGKGNVIYVTYRLAALPDVLAMQSYGATFTVTEL